MDTTKLADAARALRELGFTEIEALVYVHLLSSDPATGYRISHGIDKPTANTYKAIAALEQRGAVQVDEGENRLVRAVPPDELLAAMERTERGRRADALAALSALSRDSTDDRLYALREPGQVLERARAMLERAEGWVLGDLFPAPLAVLAEDLAAAAKRGVRVVLGTYAPAQVAGCRLCGSADRSRVTRLWPGQQLSLVVDADEHLLAMFSDDLRRVHQAVWSRSTFLSCLQHNHLAMEIMVTAHREAGRRSPREADRELAGLADISLLNSEARGLRRLRERFQQSAGPEGAPAA